MNANDEFKEYTATDNYYRHPLGIVYTDGVRALATRFECYWFVDVIASYQRQLKLEPFQVWRLDKKDDESAVVTCTEGNDRILQTQRIPYTDFAADEATIWLVDDVALLPSEY